MATLLIELPLEAPSPGAVLDYVRSTDGLSVQQHARVAWAQWPVFAERFSEVVLVLPLAALSWHRVQLPPGSLPKVWGRQQGQARLRAILDGLLEEHLLDEPAALHMALQPDPGAQAKPWVVTCDRAWLSAWLDAFGARGLSVKRIVPAHTPQSLAATVQVLGEPDRPWVFGLQLAGDDTAGVLACALSPAALALLGELGERTILAEPTVAQLAESQLGPSVQLLARQERLMQAAASAWNLAQFELAGAVRGQRWSGLRQIGQQLLHAPPWRAARWAMLGLVLVNLIGLNAWAWHLRSTLQQQGQQVRALLTQTFPSIPVVVDAPAQMARQVEQLQRSRGALTEQALEALLSHVAELASATFEVTAVDFVAGELQLSTTPLQAAEQTRLVAGLKARGVRAQWQGGRWLLRQELPS